jgi:hypothetical protein
VVDVRDEEGLDRRRQHRYSILSALAVANHDLVRCEVHVFHAQPAALQQTETRAVEKERHEPWHSGQPLQDGTGLIAGQDHGQVLGPLGPHDTVEPRQVHAEHVSIQKEQGAECLVLGGGGDLVPYGERSQECGELDRAHLGGVSLVVEEDEPPDRVNIGLLGPPTVVPGADGLSDPVEEPGRVWSWRACLAHDPRDKCWRRVEETGSG